MQLISHSDFPDAPFIVALSINDVSTLKHITDTYFFLLLQQSDTVDTTHFFKNFKAEVDKIHNVAFLFPEEGL